MTHIPFIKFSFDCLTNRAKYRYVKVEDDILTQVARIADALERRYPGNMTPDSLPAAAACVWQSDIAIGTRKQGEWP